MRIYQITLDKVPHVDSLSTLAKVNLTYKETKTFFRSDSVISVNGHDLKRKLLINSKGLDFAGLNKDLRSSNHPPLYYYLYHIIKVLTDGGSDSILTGQILNLIVWVLCGLVLFAITSRIFNNYFMSCLTVFLYAISANLADSLLLLKAYPLQELFLLLIIYVIIVQWQKERIGLLGFVFYGILCYCFLLLHYYSYIHLAFISLLVLVIYSIGKRGVMRIIQYGVSTLISIGLAVLTYPRIISDLKKDTRSTEIQDKIIEVDLIDQLIPSMKLLIETIGVSLLVLALIFGVIALVKKHRTQNHVSFWWILVCLFLVDILLISMLSPYNSIRYIAPILPIIYIGLAACFIPFFERRLLMALSLVTILALMLPSHFEYDKDKRREEKRLIQSEFGQEDVVVVYKDRISSLRKLIYALDCESYVFIKTNNSLEGYESELKEVIFLDQKVDDPQREGIVKELSRMGYQCNRNVFDFSVYRR